MDKKSLFVGMGLGAVIAFSGMLLGGMNRNAQDMPEVARPDAEIHDFEVIRCREIQMLGAKGGLSMKISGTDAGGVFSVMDSKGQEAVRIASSLHGGGMILTRSHGVPSVTISGSNMGGAIQVHEKTDKGNVPVVEVRATPKGGWIGTKDNELNVTGQMPELLKNRGN